MQSLYTDGSSILHNPSIHGGAWAWLLVEDGAVLRQESGYLLPFEEGWGAQLTSNQMEFAAGVKALEAMPRGWSGDFCSDSQNTIGRLFHHWKTAGIPAEWVARGRAVFRRLGEVTPIALAGHPTAAALQRGFKRRGPGKASLPVSIWNQKADQECTRQGQLCLAKHYRAG